MVDSDFIIKIEINSTQYLQPSLSIINSITRQYHVKMLGFIRIPIRPRLHIIESLAIPLKTENPAFFVF